MKIKEIKRINNQFYCDFSFLVLRDMRIVTSSYKRIRMKVYDSNFEYQYSIAGHTDHIITKCLLDNDDMVSISHSDGIKIWEVGSKSSKCVFIIKKPHDSIIATMLLLSCNRFATCAEDNTIKIWKGDKPYSKIPIKLILRNDEENYFHSMIYLKEKEILTVQLKDCTLMMFSMITYQCVTVVKSEKATFFFQVDEDKVIINLWNR